MKKTPIISRVSEASPRLNPLSLSLGRVKPAYEQISDQIRNLIIRGELVPGDRLPVEADLCEIFSVGRSTVREALRTLASENLLITKRGSSGGTFIEQPNEERLRINLEVSIGLMTTEKNLTVSEILEARELLEVPAAVLAARRWTPETLERIKNSLPGSDDIDLHHKFEGNKDFHYNIMVASGNKLLASMSMPLYSVLRNRFLRDRAPIEFWQEVASDHQLIFLAIKDRDEKESGRLMKDHLSNLKKTYAAIDQENQTES